MRRWIIEHPYAVLLALPFAAHLPQFLLGLSTDPIWYYSYAVSGVRPGPLLGQPYLDPNMGFVTESLGRLAASDWVHGVVPWWDPYTGVGMPLAGGMQPGAFFLPFNLLLLLPAGTLWLAIAMQLLAGFTTLALLRILERSALATLACACLYELNCTIAWTPGIAAIYGGLPFLPLLLWGIERARAADGGAAARLAIGIGIAYQILAGFPEAGYLNGMLALAWAVLRGAAAPAKWVFAARVAAGGLMGVLVAAPLLIAFADYLAQSDVLSTHAQDHRWLSGQAFGMLFLPYAFGALGDSHGSALLWKTWSVASGYTGIVLFLLALAAFASGGQWRLKCLLAGWVVLVWGRTYGLPPCTWLMDLAPGMRDVEVYRYAAPSWDLAFVILAAFGLDEMRRFSRWQLAMCLVLLAVSAGLEWPGRIAWGWPPGALALVYHWWFGSVLWALAGLALAALLWNRKLALAALLVSNAYAGFILPQLSGVKPGQVDAAPLAALRAAQGYKRLYTLGPLLPNYGAYFGVAEIDHNMIPTPRIWVNYVDRRLLPGTKPGTSAIVFWPSDAQYGPGAGPRDLLANLANYEALGVGYVLDWPGAVIPGLSLVYGDSVMSIWRIPSPAPYFSAPGCALSGIRRERVTLDCAAPTTLLRRELFMPGWHAWVNGAPARVALADQLFQAVPVPAGRSVVRYQFTPLYMGWGWLAGAIGLMGLLKEARGAFLKKLGRPVRLRKKTFAS